jgi:ketosteroid isomerase-like protein
MRAIELSRNTVAFWSLSSQITRFCAGLKERKFAADMSIGSWIMNKIGFAVIVCSALVFASAQNRAGRDPVTKVLALENVWNQAEERKDTKAMDALLDNALVYVDYDGSFQTKAEFLARVKSATSQPQQETTGSVTGHMFGGTVIVTGLYRATGMENGKSYVRRGRFVDTWTLKAGNWVCVASQATPIAH